MLENLDWCLEYITCRHGVWTSNIILCSAALEVIQNSLHHSSFRKLPDYFLVQQVGCSGILALFQTAPSHQTQRVLLALFQRQAGLHLKQTSSYEVLSHSQHGSLKGNFGYSVRYKITQTA